MHKVVKVNANEISMDELRVMLTDQTKLNALADMAEKARLTKMELNGRSFTESFFHQVSSIIRK